MYSINGQQHFLLPKRRLSFSSLSSFNAFPTYDLLKFKMFQCFNVLFFGFISFKCIYVLSVSFCSLTLIKVTPIATTHSNCFRPSSFSPKKTAPNKAETTMPPPRFTAETSTGLIKETALHANSFRDDFFCLHLSSPLRSI